MKFGCYPPLKIVVSHNNKGMVFPLEAARAVFHIIGAVLGVQLGMILLESLHVQDFGFNIVIQVIVVNIRDSHYGLNVPFGIISALRTYGIKANSSSSEGSGV